jgi:DNA polymerase elongation subunit (family B)
MRKLSVLDLETDPFEYNVVPKPFVAEYYDGDESIVIWHPDCVRKLVARLRERKTPTIIYAHNGGKFDYLYFLEHLDADMRIVNGRIIQANIGQHELRDSYAIMPFPLRDFDKDEIDYEKMRSNVREKHRDEILKYLHKDCTSLYELVTQFVAEFGDALTIGGSALRQLKTHHKFACGGPHFDAKFRKDFYFGGRVQVFKSGIIQQPIEIDDVNSMYPYVMKSYLHPVSSDISVAPYIEKRRTAFVIAEGRNYGAFPVRTKAGGLDFTVESGRFCTTIHEWNAALETGCFKPTRIVKTYGFDRLRSFGDFVDHFYDARKHAKVIGDKIHTIFYKYVLNSSYGKFAQNPDNYSEWRITQMDGKTNPHLPLPWTPAYIYHGKYIIWEKPLDRQHFYNVCTGASITGASRAVLLRAIHGAVDPIYCDTDSIMCRSLSSVALNDNELGAWKHEGSGTLAAIAGKKLYAVFAPGPPPAPTGNAKPLEAITYNRKPYHCIKKAHKGARLTGAEILRIAQGEIIECRNPVPAFNLDGTHTFTTRKVRRTS